MLSAVTNRCRKVLILNGHCYWPSSSVFACIQIPLRLRFLPMFQPPPPLPPRCYHLLCFFLSSFFNNFRVLHFFFYRCLFHRDITNMFQHNRTTRDSPTIYFFFSPAKFPFFIFLQTVSSMRMGKLTVKEICHGIFYLFICCCCCCLRRTRSKPRFIGDFFCHHFDFHNHDTNKKQAASHTNAVWYIFQFTNFASQEGMLCIEVIRSFVWRLVLLLVSWRATPFFLPFRTKRITILRVKNLFRFRTDKIWWHVSGQQASGGFFWLFFSFVKIKVIPCLFPLQ